MESQARTAGAAGGGGGYHETANKSSRLVNYVLRFLALGTTFIAAIVAGTASETEPVAGTNSVSLHLKVRTAGMPQFDYFLAVNVIVCFYSAVSLGLWVVAKGEAKSLIVVLATVDIIAVVLLFSALGSASAMAILFRKGNSPAAIFPRICNLYGKFCAQVFAAITMSTFAAVACLILIFLALLSLYYSSL